jgi:hypothetical protein
MQFGRFHGVALLVLGTFLLLVQAFVIFEGRVVTRPTNLAERSSPSPAGPVPSRTIDYLPGAVGIGLVALGGFVLMLGQKKILEQFRER